jgi:flagellar hook-basal body complex protein FliE
MDPIQPIRLDALSGAQSLKGPAASTGTGFADALTAALDKVSASQNEADRLAKEIQLDNPEVSLEESVLATQKAGIAFQAVVQVRNKMVQAYHDIMNMSV